MTIKRLSGMSLAVFSMFYLPVIDFSQQKSSQAQKKLRKPILSLGRPLKKGRLKKYCYFNKSIALGVTVLLIEKITLDSGRGRTKRHRNVQMAWKDRRVMGLALRTFQVETEEGKGAWTIFISECICKVLVLGSQKRVRERKEEARYERMLFVRICASWAKDEGIWLDRPVKKNRHHSLKRAAFERGNKDKQDGMTECGRNVRQYMFLWFLL